MDLSAKDLKKYQNFAEKIAIKAGNILLSYKNKFLIKKQKDLIDIATSADFASEKFIISEISKSFPSHRILSEEQEKKDLTRSDFEWIIDPLDGTKEYVRNMPYYCVNVALEHRGKLIVGTVYQPEVRRLYSCANKSGSSLNDTSLYVSMEKDLNKSFVYLRMPDFRMTQNRLDKYSDLFQQLIKKVYRVRGEVWDVEALSFVAMGGAEGYVLPSYDLWHPGQWWDYASGLIMVEEAGGKVTDFFGQPITNKNLLNGIIASNGSIHDQLLNLVSGYLNS